MEEKTYLVLFWGKIIPLQGVEYIRKAVEPLRDKKNITVRIIGDPPVAQAELPAIIRQADICLGTFGDTDKATRVIPNKVYEAIAMGKSVISADTPAIRELFIDRENILLCRRTDPQDLADKIVYLVNDHELRNKIAKGAYQLYQKHASPKVIGAELLKKIKNKAVVYTAIFGEKDRLIEPKFVPKNCDLVCFTDDKNLKSKTWQIRYQEPTDSDPVRSAKIFKILPHKYFSEYDHSVWVDGNFLIKGDVNQLLEKYLEKNNIAFFSHAQNKLDPINSVYAELKNLVAMTEKGKYKDDLDLMQKQVEKYRGENFPDSNGLITGMIILRRHNQPDVIKLMEAWWQEIKQGSRRDQLSFNYAAWKLGIDFAYMQGDSRNNKYFKWQPHQK